MNQLTQLPSILELEERASALRAQLPAHLRASRDVSRPSAVSREALSYSIGDELGAQLMILEGLKVEALLLLEQAGIRRVSRAEELDLSSDLSNQVTEDLPLERSPGHSQRPAEVTSEGDLLEELENYVSPLELMERELAELAAQQAEAESVSLDPLEEVLSSKTMERAAISPEPVTPVKVSTLTLASGALGDSELPERRLPPTRKVDEVAPEIRSTLETEARPLETPSGRSEEPALSPEQLVEVARQMKASAEPSEPAPARPAPPPSARPVARSETQWKRTRAELKALLLPLTRSPDAELAIYGAGPRLEPVDHTEPWLRRDEVSWRELDWRVIEEQLGPYASISMAPRSFSPRAQLDRRPVELRLEERGYLESEQTLPSTPPVAYATDDSLDVDDAFAEYDAPVSDEELRSDPELADMADAYSALESSLIAPDVQALTDEFSDRDGLFEDSLSPRVSAHLEAEYGYGDDHDETGSLDELLGVNPLEEEEEMVFDFGEDSPLVWTEGSPTPLFSEEPTPSPVFQRGARARSDEPAQAEASPSAERAQQRSGVFERLFNKGK